jgi:hypothetical protein
MRGRFLAWVGIPAAVIGTAWLTVVLTAAQGARPGAKSPVAEKAPAALRTPWGDPDLQGIWNASGATPMERPAAFAGRDSLTDDEIARLNRQDAANADLPPGPGDPGAYNDFWFGRGKRTRQTSMVVDPPDGRFPPLTPAGEAAKKNLLLGAESWEDRHLWERCITRGGMPNAMFPRAYNNNAQVFQGPGFVAILMEQIHETRLIPIDGRPHVSQSVRQWMGDSRGHWEGDTLVVDTTNISERVSALQPWADFNSRRGSGERLHIVERFRRVDTNTIEYTITVDDPQMYTRPWTVRYPMTKTTELMYEYACHEGNYGMVGMLAAGRAEAAKPDGAKSGEPGVTRPR